MNCKRKGSKNEHRSIKLLESLGYSVTRAAASLGVFDLVAIGAADIVLCQVKSNRWPGAKEVEAIKSFTAPPNARRIIHRWRDRQSKPDVREVSGTSRKVTLSSESEAS